MSRENNLKGSIREARAVLDLMQRGFEVFRPTSTATCDLVALKYGTTLRVEVTGGLSKRPSASGPVTQQSSSGGSCVDCRLFDLLMRYTDEGDRCVYLPSMYLKKNKATKDLPILWEPSKHTPQKNLSRIQQLEKEC